MTLRTTQKKTSESLLDNIIIINDYYFDVEVFALIDWKGESSASVLDEDKIIGTLTVGEKRELLIGRQRFTGTISAI